MTGPGGGAPEISVVRGRVQVGVASSWQQARQLLRDKVIYSMCPAWHVTCPVAAWRDEQLAAIEAPPVELTGGSFISVTSHGWPVAVALEGTHGLVAGDEACLHSYYVRDCPVLTICVRAQITAISDTVTVEVLDGAQQVSAGDVVTTGYDLIFPWGHQGT